MIDSLFDRVIVISLPSNSERREHIRQHFAETGITNYEFFDAINGAELDLAALKRAGILADNPPSMATRTSARAKSAAPGAISASTSPRWPGA